MQPSRNVYLAACLLCVCTHASPASEEGADDALPNQWMPVEGELLEQSRGGFIGASGLKISFGIERAIRINGELINASRLIGDNFGTLTARRETGADGPGENAVPPAATAAIPAIDPAPAASGLLVQNGPGNSVADLPGANGNLGTFIQNSLNDQTIQAITVINAASNSLELLKSLQLGSTLQDALAGSASLR